MMQDLVEFFKSLSDETRLRILNLLYERELCVCDVMEVLGISQSKASRHLIALKRVGLVNDRRVAQWMHYSLVPEKEAALVEEIVVTHLRKVKRCMEDLKLLRDWLKNKECKNSQCMPRNKKCSIISE